MKQNPVSQVMSQQGETHKVGLTLCVCVGIIFISTFPKMCDEDGNNDKVQRQLLTAML